MGPEVFIIVFAAFVPLTLVAFGIVFQFSSTRRKQQTEIRKALIEKFGSAQDLGAFLQSDGGRRVFADLSTGASAPMGAVLGSIQKGIILFLLGFGFSGASAFLGPFRPLPMFVGLVLMCTGIGFLVSAAVTYFLSKSWGLIEKKPREN